MTEDDAKKRWCPFARVTLKNGHGAGNRTMIGDWGGDGGKNAIERKASCIGAQCMAWRWQTLATQDREGRIIQASVSATDGYCGLAGNP